MKASNTGAAVSVDAPSDTGASAAPFAFFFAELPDGECQSATACPHPFESYRKPTFLESNRLPLPFAMLPFAMFALRHRHIRLVHLNGRLRRLKTIGASPILGLHRSSTCMTCAAISHGAPTGADLEVAMAERSSPAMAHVSRTKSK